MTQPYGYNVDYLEQHFKITIMKFRSLFLLLCSFLLTLSCENEDIDDNLFFTTDLIARESELFDLLNEVTEEDSELTCIEFIYSFTVAIFNENTQEETAQIVSNDGEFYSLLDSLEDGYSIGISFPITSALEDGTTFEVNNTSELQEAIGECKEQWQEEVIGECSGIIQECVWEVSIPEDIVFSTYIDAVYDVNGDGTVVFYHRGIAYDGTWIVYFIEDELHLNINIDDQDEVGLDWNFDWKISSYSSSLILLENDQEDRFVLNRECEEENYCTTLTFTECELQDQPGFADFDLASYVDCIVVIAAPQPEIDPTTGDLPEPIDWEINFYETATDAQQDVNPISTVVPYLNAINGQELYVRILNPEDQSFTVAVITLEAVFCE